VLLHQDVKASLVDLLLQPGILMLQSLKEPDVLLCYDSLAMQIKAGSTQLRRLLSKLLSRLDINCP